MIKNIMHRIREIRNYKPLLMAFIRKNLISNYKNSVIGFGWHFVHPLILIIVYYVTFSTSNTMVDSFEVYLLSSIFIFSFMVSSILNGATHITGNSQIINKMYFPREILIIANVVSNSLVMVIGNIGMICILLIIGYPISSSIIILPGIMILAFLFSLGCSLLLSSINVYYRDVQYVLGSIGIIFYFITPVYFIESNSTGLVKTIIQLNPLTYFVDTCHIAIYNCCIPPIENILVCVLLSICTFIFGYTIFIKLEQGFSERV